VTQKLASALKNFYVRVLLQTMLSEWEIKTRSHLCAQTDEPFQDGMTIYTLLFREHAGFQRVDVSEEGWRQIKEISIPFSFWKSKYEVPPPRPSEAMPKESTEELLRRLMQNNDLDQVNARYVLAIMLERKKTLKQVAIRETSEEKLLIYEHVKSGEAFIIADPRLHLDQLDAVQQEVFDLLGLRGQTQQPEP
jgi:hypothetical protein